MLKAYTFIILSMLVCLGALPLPTSAFAQEEEASVSAPAVSRTVTVEDAPAGSLLNAGDQIRLYVFGVQDLSGEFSVDMRGVLTLPLIGEIKAQGLSKKQLEEQIAEALIEGQYYNDPKVTVEVMTLQPFYILGEVKNPGSYGFTPDLDIFKAIATAGGYTPRAAKDKITIIRKVDGKKVRINATEDTPLMPGDSIKVEQRFF